MRTNIIYRLKRWWFKDALTEKAIHRVRIMLYSLFPVLLAMVIVSVTYTLPSINLLAAVFGALWCVVLICLMEFHMIPWSRKHRDNNPYK